MGPNLIPLISLQEETRDVHTQRKDHVRREWESDHLQPKETTLRRKQTNTLILDLQHPELWKSKYLLFKQYFVMSAPEN